MKLLSPFAPLGLEIVEGAKHARLARFRVEAMRSCCLLVVGLQVATAAALRAPAASPSRRAAILSAGSAVTSCLLSRPAFAGGAAAPSAARTPPARDHARALPTDADDDREIAALTKKIAAD